MAQLPKPSKPIKPATLKIDDVYEFVGVVYDLMVVVENNIKDVVANQQTLLQQQQQSLSNQSTAMADIVTIMKNMGISQQLIQSDVRQMTDRNGNTINIQTRRST